VCNLFFFSSRRRHTRFSRDWSSDVCSSDLVTQLLIQCLGGVSSCFTFAPAHRADHHLERGNGSWPDNSFIVMVLFHGSGRNAADAYAVTAHLHYGGLAVGIKVSGVQSLGVFVAKEKDVPDFDSALNRQASTLGVRVTVNDVTQVGDFVRFG